MPDGLPSQTASRFDDLAAEIHAWARSKGFYDRERLRVVDPVTGDVEGRPENTEGGRGVIHDGTEQRKLTNGSNGYYCIDTASGSPVLQGEINEHETAVWVGCDRTITIDKMFGPLAFFPIRVTADFESCEWIVERLYGKDNEWREVVRIPGQLREDFEDDGDDG